MQDSKNTEHSSCRLNALLFTYSEFLWRLMSCGAISGFLCLEDVWVKINNNKKKKSGECASRRTKQTWVTLNLQRICRTRKKRFAWLTWQILLKHTNMWVTGWDQETGCGHRRHLRWCQHKYVCAWEISVAWRHMAIIIISGRGSNDPAEREELENTLREVKTCG